MFIDKSEPLSMLVIDWVPLLQNREAATGNHNSAPRLLISSGEIVGMAGFRYRIRERMFFTLGISYDNNHAVLIRPGLTFNFNRPGRTRPQ
jgi:hypothetical protein